MKMPSSCQYHNFDIWVQKFIKHNKSYFCRNITGLPAFKLGDKINNFLYIKSILLFIKNLGYDHG